MLHQPKMTPGKVKVRTETERQNDSNDTKEGRKRGKGRGCMSNDYFSKAMSSKHSHRDVKNVTFLSQFLLSGICGKVLYDYFLMCP